MKRKTLESFTSLINPKNPYEEINDATTIIGSVLVIENPAQVSDPAKGANKRRINKK